MQERERVQHIGADIKKRLYHLTEQGQNRNFFELVRQMCAE